MALSMVNPAVAGQRIDSSNYNAEFNNILSNPVTLISPLISNVDFNNFQAQNLLVYKGASFPANGNIGKLFYHTGNQALYVDDGTNWDLVGPGTLSGAGSKVKGLICTISSNLGGFMADEIVMRTTGLLADASIAVTCTSGFAVNSQTPGPVAGGRDTVAAFNSTYYYFYAISTGAGSTGCVGICSTAAPDAGGPVFPTSYSAYAYLTGGAYNATSSMARRDWYQRGSWAYFAQPDNLVSSVYGSTETVINLKAQIPPNANNYLVTHRGSGGIGTSTGGLLVSHTLRAIAGTIYHQADVQYNLPGVASPTLKPVNTAVTVPNLNSPNSALYYQSSVVTGTSGALTLDLLGWDNPNGDV